MNHFGVDQQVLKEFLIEAKEILEALSQQLIELEHDPSDRNLLNAVFRGFHTIKGAAGFLSLEPLVQICHSVENIFDSLRSGQRLMEPSLMDVILQALDRLNEMVEAITAEAQPQPAVELIERLSAFTSNYHLIQEEEFDNYLENLQKNKPEQPIVNTDEESIKKEDKTVRIGIKHLDAMMNLVGELVLVRNRLMKIKGDVGDDTLSKTVSTLDRVTADLQIAVMKTRMQPVKKVFGRFPRLIRDLARQLKKEAVLKMTGEETDLDKNLVEALSEPLVHLLRNAMDHGIEEPSVRMAAGKPKEGQILLAAQQMGDQIVLSISDDGRGMDPVILKQKAVEKQLLDPDLAQRLTIKECFNLVFLPGFSTKEEISDISGRGVGMDVVKTKMTQLNGSVDIDSVQGQGTHVHIKVPLTLAILPILMVLVGQQVFGLPLAAVNETLALEGIKTHVFDGQLVAIVREKTIPLFYLSHWVNQPSNVFFRPIKAPLMGSAHKEHVVVLSVGMDGFAFVVDALLGQEEVVIKALGEMLQGTAGIAGATITGDGRIAMVLDIPALLKNHTGYPF